MTVNVFAVPGKHTKYLREFDTMLTSSDPKVFFILFRETLETSIIVSVLLAFLKQTLGHDNDLTTYKKLKRQVGHWDDRYEN